MVDPEPIKALARKAAQANLSHRDARFLFDALYVSDALMMAGGSRTGAAKIAGVRREALVRLRSRNEDNG